MEKKTFDLFIDDMEEVLRYDECISFITRVPCDIWAWFEYEFSLTLKIIIMTSWIDILSPGKSPFIIWVWETCVPFKISYVKNRNIVNISLVSFEY